MDILAFGDSITEGLWDNKGGWADQTKTFIHQQEIENGFKNYHEFYNLGVDGNTTRQILERFEAETKSRQWPDSELGFILATGINDTLQRGENDFECTPDQYAVELAELIKKAGQFTTRILFVDLTPVDETFTNPVASSSTGKRYTNSRIELFNRTLHKFCQNQSVECIKVSESFKAGGPRKLLATDGLHPNSTGHRLIYDLVQPKIKEWL